MTEKVKELFIILGLVSLILCISILAVRYCGSEEEVIDKTIQTNISSIETVQKRNDSIIIDVKRLDSIKNAEVITIQTIDNDSVIELFYQLIRE